MKIREQVAELLRERAGECADVDIIIEELYSANALDDVLCRRYVVAREFVNRFSKSTRSPVVVMEEIAEDYGLSRASVHRIVNAMNEG